MSDSESQLNKHGSSGAVSEVTSAAEADSPPTSAASSSAGKKQFEKFEIDFVNHRIMRSICKGEEVVGTFTACHSMLYVVARFAICDVAHVLIKEVKAVSDKVEARHHVLPRVKLGKRSIWDTMTILDVLLESSSDKLHGWLADQLVRAAAEAPKLPTFDRAGFQPEQGVIVFEDGVLDGGGFLPADANGLVFTYDQKPMGIIVRNDSRALFPLSTGFRDLTQAGELDSVAYNEALKSLIYCRGNDFPLHLMNEVVRFCVTVGNARECCGASIPMSYFTGPSDAGKSQSARDIMYFIHGHSRTDEQAYSQKGTFPRLRSRLCVSALPALVNEANKKGPLALVEGSELHDRHILSLYDRSDFSHANESQKPIGTLIFTGSSFEPTSPEVEKRILVSEVPFHSRISDEASVHFRKLETSAPVIRQAFIRFMIAWSRSPSSYKISVMENARRARSELETFAKSLGLDVPATDLGHYALSIACAKATDADLHMHDECVAAVHRRMQDHGQGRTFANTLDALKLIVTVLLGISKAEGHKDEFGIAEINASRTALSVSISKAKDRAKGTGRANMPITESMVLRELSIVKSANDRHVFSPKYSWIEWHRDNKKSRKMRLNGACGLTFNYAEDSGMPSILRDACEEIASRFVVCTQNNALEVNDNAWLNQGAPPVAPASLPSNVVGLHNAR